MKASIPTQATAERRLGRIREHLSVNSTASTPSQAARPKTKTSTTTSKTSSTAAAPPNDPTTTTTIDLSKPDLKLRGWGYTDTQFFLNEEQVVELSGDRYPDAFPPNVKRVFPRLKEFMEDRLHMNVEETSFMCDTMPALDPPIRNSAFLTAVHSAISGIEMYEDHKCRLRHALGCTMEEVWSMRYAERIERAPDIVIYPRSHQEVEIIVKAAVDNNVVIIPYGGGTTVSGAIHCPKNEQRCIVSMDMARMCRIRWVDRENMLACIEVGTIGTEIERKLGKLGLIMGHEPDSYEHSTMGGWIATVRFYFSCFSLFRFCSRF